MSGHVQFAKYVRAPIALGTSGSKSSSPSSGRQKGSFSHQVIVQPLEMLVDEFYPYKNASSFYGVPLLMKKNSFSKVLNI